MHCPTVYTPSLRHSNDREAIVLALLIATKNAFRRLGMMLPVPALLALLAHVPGLGALGTWGKGGAGAGAGPSATAEDIQVKLYFLLLTPPSPYHPCCSSIVSHRGLVSLVTVRPLLSWAAAA
jgi:hypothetical protein